MSAAAAADGDPLTDVPAPARLRVLLLGSGGREHALAHHLLRCARLDRVYLAPGNGGTATLGPRCSNLVRPKAEPGVDGSWSAIVRWAVENEINLVVPGPEQPLVDGVELAFRKVGIPVFGPSPLAARMEGSKAYAKRFMARHAIPTAEFATFGSRDVEEAEAFVRRLGGATKVVLKASGLAAGKGVLLPETEEECRRGIHDILVAKCFGEAGSSLVIESRLTGPELSILTFSDGYAHVSLPCCQDHKRVGEGDTGPNTGGMGAYAPAPEGMRADVAQRIESEVVEPTIRGMRKDGLPFVGMLFTGLMLTPEGPKVLEYNVRFGDPETEAVLELLDVDEGRGGPDGGGASLADILLACAERRLDSVEVKVKRGVSAVAVVMASGGYPGKYATGKRIEVGALPQGVQVYHAGTKLGESGELLTSGGRVLAVSASGPSLEEAVSLAYAGVDAIRFEGAVFRRDIAHRALASARPPPPPPVSSSGPADGSGASGTGTTTTAAAGGLTYASAGVDVDAGNRLVDVIKPLARSTRRPGCEASLGGFGGVFDLRAARLGFEDPLLVSGTDGVGTKLRVALDVGKHDTVGIDLVAMSVNDLLVQGATPLYFLDYYACSKLDVSVASQVIGGVARGCRESRCGLVGGETAEMPGMYRGDDYDVAGFAVGAVERSRLLPRLDEVREGDVLLGLTSSGLHSNGFSLARRIVERSGLAWSAPVPWREARGEHGGDGAAARYATLGEAFLEPTRIYVEVLTRLLGLVVGAGDGDDDRDADDEAARGAVRALCHITGGGFTDNLPRVLPPSLGATVDLSGWTRPAMFAWLQREGGVTVEEMARTFNNGVGMVLVVEASRAELVRDVLQRSAAATGAATRGGKEGVEVVRVGTVKRGAGVEYIGTSAWEV